MSLIRYMSNFHVMLLCQDSTSGVQTGQQCLSHCIHTKLLEVFFFYPSRLGKHWYLGWYELFHIQVKIPLRIKSSFSRSIWQSFGFEWFFLVVVGQWSVLHTCLPHQCSWSVSNSPHLISVGWQCLLTVIIAPFERFKLSEKEHEHLPTLLKPL